MKRFMLFIIIWLPLAGFGQAVQFKKDSIPLVAGKVVFSVEFKFDLPKEELHKRAFSYLNGGMDPYFGEFSMNNDDYTLCKITDYIDFGNNLLQTFGMYMTYNLQLAYKDGSCIMVIRDITYMEKSYFEAQEESKRKLNMPVHPGVDIMVHKKYSLMMKKDASERITEASIKRINDIIKSLDTSFGVGKNSSIIKNTDEK